MNFQGLELPQIVATSAQWLVLSKPAGWLTIPGRTSFAASSSTPPILSEWAKAQWGEAWIVHRLDRETSGVFLLARTPQSHALANGWFQKRQMKKVYHCLAAPAQGSPILRIPILKINEPIEGAPSVT